MEKIRKKNINPNFYRKEKQEFKVDCTEMSINQLKNRTARNQSGGKWGTTALQVWNPEEEDGWIFLINK